MVFSNGRGKVAKILMPHAVLLSRGVACLVEGVSGLISLRFAFSHDSSHEVLY
jgi:hypothetical protein